MVFNFISRSIILATFGLFGPVNAIDYTLGFDETCEHYGVGGRDVRPLLQTAFDTAKTVAASAGTRLAWAYNGGVSNANRQSQLSDEQIWEIVRIERLEATFSVSPYASSGQFVGTATGTIFHEPNEEGYDETMLGFLSVLNTLADMDPERVPTMYCGIPLSPPGTDKFGTVERYTEWEGEPILDDDGQQSFAYLSFLTPDLTEWFPVGVEICEDGGHVATLDWLQSAGYRQWMIFCDYFFTAVEGSEIPAFSDITLPVEDDRGSDFESMGFPFDQLSYWHSSAAGVTLHEMHHIFVPGSKDMKIPYQFTMPGSGQTIPANTMVAYGYVLTSILAGQVIQWDEPYDTLWLNPDQVAIMAIGIYLFGCDWAKDTAQRLADVAFAVPGDTVLNKR